MTPSSVSTWLSGFILLAVIIGIMPLSGQIEVIYFYEEGCSQCEAVSLILDELAQEYSLTVERYDVATVEGYRLFREYGFTLTPALVIQGETMEGQIGRTDILDALQGRSHRLIHYITALVLGLLSGLSPTLMGVHTDIISEVARTTREEKDVVTRSLLFYAGIFAIAFCVFFVFSAEAVYQTVGAFFGFVIFLNLLNSALHSFNSYTRIDLYIKAQFITLEPASALKLGLFHGLGKFSDSVPFFIPVLYLIGSRGSLSQDVIVFVLFLTGIVIVYVLLLVLAIVQLNIFRRVGEEWVRQVYFSAAGLLAMAVSVLVFLEVMHEFNLRITFFLMVIIIVISGVLIGFKRRIVF